VLSGKDLVEQGTFGDLMAARGQFYRLYMAQFSGFHAFQERLDYELKRAREYREALPILAVRIENFDHILSNVGSEKGEQILHDVSSTISESLREIDFMTHDSNERNLFYMVMPKTGSNELAKIQKKIKARIPEGIRVRFGTLITDIYTETTGELIDRSRELVSQSV
jgi:diguanylate cyclase (GGDEF)-like protein